MMQHGGGKGKADSLKAIHGAYAAHCASGESEPSAEHSPVLNNEANKLVIQHLQEHGMHPDDGAESAPGESAMPGDAAEPGEGGDNGDGLAKAVVHQMKKKSKK